MTKPTHADEWMRNRVEGEVDRMLQDFSDRNLSVESYDDRQEMAGEIVEMVLTKRWRRA